jgi:membrane protein DedA with SNARE-associated domain
MEFLDKETIAHLLLSYGSIVLFFLLALGILALPIPDETLIVLSGILIKSGHLYFVPTLLSAYTGSLCGITLSYLLGRYGGHYLLERYGGWIGLTEKKREYIHQWVDRFGKWTLFFGYFVPGLRHFTGLCTGMMGLDYHSFAIFAYAGALVWVATFLSVGYFFGEYCMEYCLNLFTSTEITVENVSIAILIAAVLLFIAVYLWRKLRR